MRAGLSLSDRASTGGGLVYPQEVWTLSTEGVDSVDRDATEGALPDELNQWLGKVIPRALPTIQ